MARYHTMNGTSLVIRGADVIHLCERYSQYYTKYYRDFYTHTHTYRQNIIAILTISDIRYEHRQSTHAISSDGWHFASFRSKLPANERPRMKTHSTFIPLQSRDVRASRREYTVIGICFVASPSGSDATERAGRVVRSYRAPSRTRIAF